MTQKKSNKLHYYISVYRSSKYLHGGALFDISQLQPLTNITENSTPDDVEVQEPPIYIKLRN